MNWKKIEWNKPVSEVFGLKPIVLYDMKFAEPLSFTIIAQLILYFFFGMALDGGILFQNLYFTSLAFWGSVVVLLLRKRWNPSPADLFYVKWGFFPILIIAPFIALFVWHLRGVS